MARCLYRWRLQTALHHQSRASLEEVTAALSALEEQVEEGLRREVRPRSTTLSLLLLLPGIGFDCGGTTDLRPLAYPPPAPLPLSHCLPLLPSPPST